MAQLVLKGDVHHRTTSFGEPVMKKLSFLLVLSGLISVPAMAEEASPHSLTANGGLYSQYIFRGMTQTAENLALQGGLDYAHSSGFYVGAWGSNVSWLNDYQGYNTGSLELDLYGGFRGGFGDSGVTFDVGVLHYNYPGTRPAAITNANTTELYGAIGWKWLSAKLSYSLDDTFGFATPSGSTYLDLSASFPVGETGLTLMAHWGEQDFKGAANDLVDYTDWKLGVSYDLGKVSKLTSGMTVGLMYTDTDSNKAPWTDANGLYMGDSQVTAWISKTF